jgi:hypothetical protein
VRVTGECDPGNAIPVFADSKEKNAKARMGDWDRELMEGVASQGRIKKRDCHRVDTDRRGV